MCALFLPVRPLAFGADPKFLLAVGAFVAKTGKYSLSAKWQTILSNAGASGQILGLVLNGFISERFGYRWTMMASMFMMNAYVPPTLIQRVGFEE